MTEKKIIDLLKDKKAVDYEIQNYIDYIYRTEDGNVHLLKNGVDILENKKAINCYSYSNGSYAYQTKDKYWHLEDNDGEDILGLEKVVKVNYYSYPIDSFYFYQTENLCLYTYRLPTGFYSYKSKNWELCQHGYRENRWQEWSNVVEYTVHSNGDYFYKTKDNFWHLIRNGKDLLKNKKATSCYLYDNGDYSYQIEKNIGT